MRIPLPVGLITLLLFGGGPCSSVWATPAVVFDSFLPDGSVNAIGWAITGPPNGPSQTLGMAFSPSGSYLMNSVSVALGLLSGPNSIALSLRSDSGGVPGDILESWSLTGLPPWPGLTPGGRDIVTYPPTTVNSSITPVLEDGEQYWLVVAPGDPATHAGWSWNQNPAGPYLRGTVGLLSSINPPDTWQLYPDSSHFSAFKVFGSPVPEPGTLLLLSTGLAGLAVTAWRKASHTSK